MALFDFILGFGKPSILRQRGLTERELIRREAKIGSEIFGPIPAGHRREFFCLDRNTWVWHEEWIDQNGKRQDMTTRYEIRGSRMIKAQQGRPYQEVTGNEAQHLLEAIEIYYQRVMEEVYGQRPQQLPQSV